MRTNAASRCVFRAQLVMEDATGSNRKLKRSKRHGELVLDAGTQSAQLVYPRVGQFFRRKFEQPRKCVVGRKLLRVYSNNGNRSFTCQLTAEEDVVKCTTTLRSFGVEVIGVGESMLEMPHHRRNSGLREAAVLAGGEAALQSIRTALPGSMQAEIRDYADSSQLQDDTEAIVREMFSIDS